MPRSALPEGYSRRHRFSQRGSFGPVLRSPRKLRGKFAVLHFLDAPAGRSRFGIALTRRVVSDATDRNRLKRVARETYRRQAERPEGIDCVLSLKVRPGRQEEGEFVAELHALLQRLPRQRLDP